MKRTQLVKIPNEPISKSHSVSLSILVADDEQPIVQLLSRSLRVLQHRVVGHAKNGQEAVALARELKPELVILDIDMPVMDGINAAREIMKTQNVPVIISTGAADESTLRRIRHLRIGAYLVKPFSCAQLKAAIFMAMSLHEQANEKTGVAA